MKLYHIPAAVFITLLLSACNTKEDKPVADDPLPPITNDTTDVAVPDMYRYIPVDISPMDMCYFPVNYSKLKMTNAITTPPLARIIYSRPHLEGRQLFTDILRYGEPWRLGANEATEITFYTNAVINNSSVKAGRYILYCIPEKENWTIVLNTNVDCWGLQPEPAKDAERFTVPTKQIPARLEYLTIMFEKTETGADIIMAWENTEARLPVQFR